MGNLVFLNLFVKCFVSNKEQERWNHLKQFFRALPFELKVQNSHRGSRNASVGCVEHAMIDLIAMTTVDELFQSFNARRNEVTTDYDFKMMYVRDFFHQSTSYLDSLPLILIWVMLCGMKLLSKL